jgi:hypothetical protein
MARITIITQQQDALGTTLCIYRQQGAYHVGTVSSQGRCIPLAQATFWTYRSAADRLRHELAERQRWVAT